MSTSLPGRRHTIPSWHAGAGSPTARCATASPSSGNASVTSSGQRGGTVLRVIKLKIRAAAVVVAAAALAAPSAHAATLLSVDESLDKTTFEGLSVGGLSALAFTNANQALALTDNQGTTPARFFTLRITDKRVETKKVTTLKRPDGTPFTGQDFDGEGLVVEQRQAAQGARRATRATSCCASTRSRRTGTRARSRSTASSACATRTARSRSRSSTPARLSACSPAGTSTSRRSPATARATSGSARSSART